MLRTGAARAHAPSVRVVRQISPGGALRVLMTKLDASAAPAADFGALYHQRWRIEEAFKRLKCRMHLEAVSGLSQHALLIDVAAKVLADNIAALLCLAAAADSPPLQPRQCQRTHAGAVLLRLLPRLLLAVGNVISLIDDAMRLIARARTCRHPRHSRSSPRPPRHAKPHPHTAYKAGA